MKLGSWNVRGVCRPFKQQELRTWILQSHLAMVGVLETRVRAGRSSKIIDSIMPSWQSISNYTHHPNGRIWLLWDPSIVAVLPRLITDQLIHAEVLIIQKQIKLFVTFIYGQNCYLQRRQLWTSLCHLSASMGPSPWLTLGDFNVIRRPYENLGGAHNWETYFDEFNDCCRQASLEDLRFSGPLLTRSKGSGRSYLARKLDRAMVNPDWHQLFHEAEAIFQEPGASDHSPILVHLGLQLHIRRPPFRFFSYWTEHPQFENVVASAWHASRVGTPMFCLAQKIKGLKSALKTLNRTEFSNIFACTKDAREALLQIQRQLLQQQGDDELKLQEKLALDKLLFFSKAEEAFHKQKSRISWIKEGDSNSKFFHHSVKARFNRNKVMSILLENGDRTHEPAAIHAAAMHHFEKLFNGV